MNIPFTQFLRPHGERTPVTIDRPDSTAKQAADLIARGYEFHIEELTTGEVSMTCFWPQDEEDIAIEVCDNGPPVPPAIDRLVASAVAWDAENQQ